MPKPTQSTVDHLNPPNARAQGRIRVGIGGWTFAPWRKNFYPDGLPQKRELEYASSQLTAIEINGTFHSPQKPDTHARWRDETPPGFVFSLKAPRFITHGRDLTKAGPAVARFIEGVLHLGDRLGPLLWQFPTSRHFDAEVLDRFLEQLPTKSGSRRLRHVLEVRHASFACVEYLALARRHRIATVFTDSPDYPSFADLSGDFVYARLMRSRTECATGYPVDELERWAGRLRAWSSGGEPEDLPRIAPPRKTDRGARDVFAYFISAAKERNPAAAQALLSRLG